MKRILFVFATLLCLTWATGYAETQMRGYEKGNGYQYVSMGEYPYEKDGTVKPVLWRVLDVREGRALLLTEYIIDTQQVIFETDPKVIEKRTYRRIEHYEESDIVPWLDTEMVNRMLGTDPIQKALIKENGSRIFILTSEQFLTTDYGFSAGMWNEQKSRQAEGTPYCIAQRNLYVDRSIDKSPYWAATIKAPADYKLQLIGYNGHLSWGAYTRVNVGLRLSTRLDMTNVSIAGGQGTLKDPFILVYQDEADINADLASVPQEEPAVTMEDVHLPEEENEEIEAVTEPNNANAIVLSFLGDCSIGDSIQFVGASPSYHKTIDQQGYAWPFSEVAGYLKNDDLTIANLEVVFTRRTAHTDKLYNLIAAPDHVQVLLDGGVDIVNTVNNHCMDFNQSGYEDTLKTLREAGIAHFGSVYPGSQYGHDDLAVQQAGDIKIGFIGFSYPQDADQKRIANRIKTLKETDRCDLVVVSLHWGRETHMTPEPWQVTYAKQVLDAGADIIWGHHPHVIQPIHFYKGKPILYSTGNFTFGTMSKVDPSTGIFQITYEKTEDGVELKQLQVIPCETRSGPDYRPHELTDDKERQAVFAELVWKKTYAKCDNPPASFLDTGIVRFENGEMLP